MKRLFLPSLTGWGVLFALCSLSFPAAAERPTFDTTAREAIVIDYQTHAVLLEKSADERIPTASLSKLMTAYTAFGYLTEGKAKLDDMLPVSEAAWRTGGSKMFVPYPGEVKIDDLLAGMLIQSGNDACVVLAQGLAGSQQAFIAKMNETAKKLGLTNSHFDSVNGLPTPTHYMSVRDMATLTWHLIHDYPQYYHYEAEKDFTFNGIKQGNRNPLLYEDLGADGVKTGHTEESGYSLIGSAVRNGRRIIFVLAGMDSMKERGQQGERVLDWAFRAFEDDTLVKAGAPIDAAPVWMGMSQTVPVAATKDALVTLPRGARKDVKVTAIYDGTVNAPVAKGQTVGKLVVTAPDMDPINIPLETTEAVARLGPLGRMAETAGYLLWGTRR